MGCKESVGLRIEPDWKEKIDNYQEAQGYENRSKAIEELLKTGYRERNSPLLYRAKQQAKDVAVYLPMVGATVATIGIVSEALAAAAGIQIAIVLLVLAVTPLAMVEGIQRARDYVANEVMS